MGRIQRDNFQHDPVSGLGLPPSSCLLRPRYCTLTYHRSGLFWSTCRQNHAQYGNVPCQACHVLKFLFPFLFCINIFEVGHLGIWSRDINIFRATDKVRKSVITHWKLAKMHWKNKQGVKIHISISRYALGVQSSA